MRTGRLSFLMPFVPLAFACGPSASVEHGALANGGIDGGQMSTTASGANANGTDASTTTSESGGAGDGGSESTDASLPSKGDDASTPVDAGAGCVSCLPAFGATLGPSGVTFRVWAPDATAANLSIAGSADAPMLARGDGTFTISVPDLSVGATYAYTLATTSGTVSRIDPYCRQIASDGKSCVVADPNAYVWPASEASFRPAPRTSSIVYELHVASFSPQGTFAGAAARISDLADLGVNVIELMPINASSGPTMGWGYGPNLWMAPRPSYGSEDDFRAFVATAHAAGISVWLDIVMNHASGGGPISCFDAPCASGTSGLYFFGAGPYAQTPWGPRPDYTQPNVANMLLDSIDHALEGDHVNGFRWDSVSNVRALDGSGTVPGGRDLLVAGNAKIHAAGGLSVAEDLKGYAAITSADPSAGFHFDAQWDGFGYAIDPLLASPSDAARDITTVASELQGSYAGDPFARLLFLEDHDTVGNGGLRLPSEIDSADPTSWAARKRSILGGVVLFTTPGIPMIFMGEESLATGTFSAPATTLPAPTAEGLLVRAFFRDMIALRKTLPDLATTNVTVVHQNAAAHVLGYRRGQTYVVVNLANKGYTEYDVGVSDAGPWNVRLNTDSTSYGSDFGGGAIGPLSARAGSKDGQPYTLPLKLGAYSAVVLTH